MLLSFRDDRSLFLLLKYTRQAIFGCSSASESESESEYITQTPSHFLGERDRERERQKESRYDSFSSGKQKVLSLDRLYRAVNPFPSCPLSSFSKISVGCVVISTVSVVCFCEQQPKRKSYIPRTNTLVNMVFQTLFVFYVCVCVCVSSSSCVPHYLFHSAFSPSFFNTI